MASGDTGHLPWRGVAWQLLPFVVCVCLSLFARLSAVESFILGQRRKAGELSLSPLSHASSHDTEISLSRLSALSCRLRNGQRLKRDRPRGHISSRLSSFLFLFLLTDLLYMTFRLLSRHDYSDFSSILWSGREHLFTYHFNVVHNTEADRDIHAHLSARAESWLHTKSPGMY